MKRPTFRFRIQGQQWEDVEYTLESRPQNSSVLKTWPEWKRFLSSLQSEQDSFEWIDPLWEQIKLGANASLTTEPQAGPQLYQGILSQRSLLEAIVVTVAHEIETELMPATLLKNLFLETLTSEDVMSIHLDVMAVAMMRSGGSIGIGIGNDAMLAVLFQRGLHALVCHRVGHRLWLGGRTGLAYYLQSTVSRIFSADIHPAAIISSGIYLHGGGGVVIGETVVIGQDVSILQGVTLGGTGKEIGNRHPKIGSGVRIDNGAILLGNIKIGDGAIITAKSIVTKPVPPLARVSGVPAKVTSYRQLTDEEFNNQDEWEQYLRFKYMSQWQQLEASTGSE
jgi:serine O-acetyltransferase